MQTKLEHVPIMSITVSKTNEMFRDPAELTKEGLAELIDSVKAKGVIQPVLLRPTKDFPGSRTLYEVICGERRMHAALFAGLETIPANIREMSDQEAFECQVTENLQRKDVHPLKEARAYKYLMDKDSKLVASELALKFGKTEHYILTRLKLNELIPEAKKDYQAGKMTLGHALLIARLTPEDQKETIKNCSDRGYYESVHELEEFIDDSILCNLSSAAFKKDDATLVPKAGPCTTCQFRSGANQLFADIDKKDRCFKPACFEAKRAAFMAIQVKEIIETKPETVFLISHYEKLSPDLTKSLKEFDIKPLRDYEDFSTWDDGGKKMKGFWLTGHDVGTFKTVYSKKQRAAKKEAESNGAPVKQTAADIKDLISGIQQRTKRAAELDQEKVYWRVVETIKKSDAFTKVGAVKWNRTDEIMTIFMVLQHSGYGVSDRIRRKFNLPEGYRTTSDKFIQALEKLSRDETAVLIRMMMMERFAGQAPTVHEPAGKLLLRAASEFGAAPVDQFITEQTEERTKREARAAARIKDLRAQLKDPKPKATKKKSETVEA